MDHVCLVNHDKYQAGPDWWGPGVVWGVHQSRD